MEESPLIITEIVQCECLACFWVIDPSGEVLKEPGTVRLGLEVLDILQTLRLYLRFCLLVCNIGYADLERG